MKSPLNIESERCPDCGRYRTITTDLCKCGYKFRTLEINGRQKFIRKTYQKFWGNRVKRKNTISAVVVLLGIFFILQGFHIEYLVNHKAGTQEYYKVRKAYIGTDKHLQSSSQELLKRAATIKMVGVIIMSVGIISLLSKWLIRPMNVNSAKHNKYDNW